MIGSFTGNDLTTGSCNTFIGHNTQSSDNDGVRRIGIGISVGVTANDQFAFGSGNTDKVFNQFATNASFTRASDERIKKDIKTNEDLGLNFINDLRTVTYKRRAPSELPETFKDYNPNVTEPKHKEKLYGMIAQEVKAALDKNNITDFGGWVDDDGMQAISQEMFVYPLIKAVQELNAKIAELEAKINE